ncbi:hypothetical protein [Paenibacillus lentus]|uniref:Uncharacterized protein n=1 Tax=Paenibacillus lentus TaxID=1338368 RepID=A0A3Q8SDH8_9BACL|nr:hypothetical protein [Paenibacillus lentus]AZK48173.1 hypothetical protein EIM92_19995 [Paenibacillus lentus]
MPALSRAGVRPQPRTSGRRSEAQRSWRCGAVLGVAMRSWRCGAVLGVAMRSSQCDGGAGCGDAKLAGRWRSWLWRCEASSAMAKLTVQEQQHMGRRANHTASQHHALFAPGAPNKTPHLPNHFQTRTRPSTAIAGCTIGPRF